MTASADGVAVVGVGIHPFGRHPGVSGLDMAAIAARAALRDAGLGWRDVEFAAGGSDAGGNADTTVSVLGLTGVPFINVRNGCATGGSALATAHAMLASGAAETALVVGFDKHPPGAFDPRPEDWGLDPWYGETGLMLTTQFFAMKIQRYMAEHGISASTLAKVASKAFSNGARNPNAWRRRPLSEDEVLGSKMVSHPLTQYMFCSPGEGAVALVLATAAARAGARPHAGLAALGRLPHAPLRLVRGLQPVDPARVGAVADERGGGRRVRAGRDRPRGRRRRPAPGHGVRRRGHAPRRDRPVPGRRAGGARPGRRDATRRAPARQHRRWLPRERGADRRLRACARCTRSCSSSAATRASARSPDPRGSASRRCTGRRA